MDLFNPQRVCFDPLIATCRFSAAPTAFPTIFFFFHLAAVFFFSGTSLDRDAMFFNLTFPVGGAFLRQLSFSVFVVPAALPLAEGRNDL